MAGKKKGNTFIDEIKVDEASRRKGIGNKLLQSALDKHPDIMGQASNDMAVRMNYKLGMRAYDSKGTELTLEQTLQKRKENTSVGMQLPVEKSKIEKTKPTLEENKVLEMKTDYKRNQQSQQAAMMELADPNLGGARRHQLMESIKQSGKNLTRIEKESDQFGVELPTKVTSTQAKEELVEVMRELEVEKDVAYELTDEAMTVQDQIDAGKVEAEVALAALELSGVSRKDADIAGVRGYNHSETIDGVKKDVMVTTAMGDPSTVMHERGEVFYQRQVKLDSKFDDFITKTRKKHYEDTGEIPGGQSNQEWVGDMSQTYSLSDAPITGFNAKFRAILKKFRDYGRALMNRVSLFNRQLKRGQISKELQDILRRATEEPLPKRAKAKKPAKVKVEDKPFKRTKDFITEGTYEGVVNGKTYKIFRDTDQFTIPRWYDAKTNSFLGYTKKEAIEKLKEITKKKKVKGYEIKKIESKTGVSKKSIDRAYKNLPKPKDVDANIRRKINRKPSVGIPKNRRRVLVNEDGLRLTVGKKTFQDWFDDTMSNMTEKEIALARKWYADVFKEFEKTFGDAAPDYIIGWLVAQKQESPIGALFNVTRVFEQIKSGRVGKMGGLSDAELRAIKTGKRIEKGIGAKLFDFVDSALGSSTRRMFGNRPEGGQPAVIDRHAYRDVGYLTPAFRNDLVKIFGKNKLRKLQLDSNIENPTAAQYEKSSEYYNNLSEWLNENNILGGNWTPLEAQATGWMHITKAIGAVGETPQLAIKERTYNLVFGADSPYSKQYPKINKLSTKDAKSLTYDINNKILDNVENITGVKVLNRQNSVGYFGDNVGYPNTSVTIIGSETGIIETMSVIGYLGQKGSVFGSRATTKGKMNSLAMEVSLKNPTPEKMNDVYEALRGNHPDIISGAIPTENGLRITIPSKIAKSYTLAKRIKIIEEQAAEVVNSVTPTLEKFKDIEYDLEPAEIVIIKNNWEKNKHGESYLQRFRERPGRPSVQERLVNRDKPGIESTVREAVGEPKIKIKGYEVRPLTPEQKKLRAERKRLDKIAEEKSLKEAHEDLKNLNTEAYSDAKAEAEAIGKKTGEKPPPIYSGSINIEKLITPDVIKSFEIQLGKLKAKKTVSWDETGEIRDEILSDYKKMIKLLKKGKKQGILKAAEVDALRIINVNALERLKEMSESGAELESYNAVKNYYNDIFTLLNDVSSEIGRALNILKRDVSKVRLAKAQAELERGLNEREYEEFKKLNFENPLEVERFIKRLGDPKLMDYVYEYWYNMILSGVPTHMVNIASNTLWGLYQVPLRGLSGVIDAMISKFTGKERQRFVSEMIPMMAGMIPGAKKGAYRAGKVLVTGQTPLDLGTKWDMDMGTSLGAFERSPHRTLRRIAPAMSGVGRGLRAMDVWANSIAFDAQINALATRIAKQEGLKGQEAKDRILELRENPSEAMIKDAMDYAKQATFMDKPDKFTSSVLIKGRSMAWGGRFVVPFVNTLANITKRGWEHTPGLGLVRHKGYYKGTNEGYKNSASDIIAKQLVGAIIAAVILSKYDEDRFTGAVPKDKSEREAFYRQGKEPWAIRFGDDYHSYRRIEPFNMVLASAAITAEKMKQFKEGDIEEVSELFFAMADGIFNNLLDSSMLKGLTDLFNRHGKQRKSFKRFAGTFVPYSSFWRSLNRSIEVHMEGDAKARVIESLGDAFLQNVPFGTLKLKPKMNVWGEDIVLDGGVLRQFLPFKWRTDRKDPVEEELKRIDHYPSIPSDRITINGLVYDIPKKMYDEYRLSVGSGMRSILENALDVGKELPIEEALEHYKAFLDPFRSSKSYELRLMMVKELANQSVSKKLKK